MNAVAQYVYAGGFTMGMMKHFNVLAHLEDPKPFAAEVIDINRHVLGPDLEIVPEGPNGWPLESFADKNVRLLYANPPCAPFSGLNPRSVGEGWRQDTRVECIQKVVMNGLAMRPDVWMFESVPRLLTSGKELVDQCASVAMANGWSVTTFKHNTHLFGSVQTRKRVLFIAHRVQLPEPEPLAIRKTVRDALGELATWLNGRPDDSWRWTEPHANLNPLVPQGKKLREIYLEKHPPGTPRPPGCVPSTMGSYRLYWDRPSPTMTGFLFMHPAEHRHASLKEMATLADWPLETNLVQAGKMCGYLAKGLSPIFTDWLGGWIRSALDANEPIGTPERHHVEVLK